MNQKEADRLGQINIVEAYLIEALDWLDRAADYANDNDTFRTCISEAISRINDAQRRF